MMGSDWIRKKPFNMISHMMMMILSVSDSHFADQTRLELDCDDDIKTQRS